MTQQAESRLVKAIRKALDDRYGAGGKWVKIHGDGMQESGLPDIIGCLAGRFVALEAKMPGEEPTPIQRFRLEQFSRAGGAVGVVYSVEQALEIAASALQSNARSGD